MKTSEELRKELNNAYALNELSEIDFDILLMDFAMRFYLEQK